jgi:hypothetical protein
MNQCDELLITLRIVQEPKWPKAPYREKIDPPLFLRIGTITDIRCDLFGNASARAWVHLSTAYPRVSRSATALLSRVDRSGCLSSHKLTLLHCLGLGLAWLTLTSWKLFTSRGGLEFFALHFSVGPCFEVFQVDHKEMHIHPTRITQRSAAALIYITHLSGAKMASSSTLQPSSEQIDRVTKQIEQVRERISKATKGSLREEEVRAASERGVVKIDHLPETYLNSPV